MPRPRGGRERRSLVGWLLGGFGRLAARAIEAEHAAGGLRLQAREIRHGLFEILGGEAALGGLQQQDRLGGRPGQIGVFGEDERDPAPGSSMARSTTSTSTSHSSDKAMTVCSNLRSRANWWIACSLSCLLRASASTWVLASA